MYTNKFGGHDWDRTDGFFRALQRNINRMNNVNNTSGER
jgi:hypothetical protein